MLPQLNREYRELLARMPRSAAVDAETARIDRFLKEVGGLTRSERVTLAAGSHVVVPEGERLYNSVVLFSPQRPVARCALRQDPPGSVWRVHAVPKLDPVALPDLQIVRSQRQRHVRGHAGRVANGLPAGRPGGRDVSLRHADLLRRRRLAAVGEHDLRFRWRQAGGFCDQRDQRRLVFPAQLQQHIQLASFRCIENRIPVARSVNTGISGFIDSNGHMHDLLAARTEGTSVARLSLDRRVTFYTRFGDLFAGGCVLVSAGTLVMALRNGMKNRRSARR